MHIMCVRESMSLVSLARTSSASPQLALLSRQGVPRTSGRPGPRTGGTRPGEDALAQNGDDVTRGHHRN